MSASTARPANDRRYSNERLSEVFFTARDVARVMDDLGYYALWTAEHHFQREGYECLPNLIQLGLWLATQTKRLKFGCALQRAADVASDPARRRLRDGRHRHRRPRHHGGRPRLPHARGGDLRRAAARCRRQPRDLRGAARSCCSKCFNEEAFHHQGQVFRVPAAGATIAATSSTDITMVPRPKHLPVEIWMPIASGKTIDMMAQYGLKAMVTLNGEKILDDVVRAYHAACAATAGQKQLGEDMIWGAGLYLADSQEEAIRRVEPAHDERYKWFAPFGFVRYADEQGRTWGTPGAPATIPSLRDGVQQKAWFCGPPAQVIDGIKSIEAKYPGLEDFMIHWAEGLSPARVQGAAALVRPDVMPAFSGA